MSVKYSAIVLLATIDYVFTDILVTLPNGQIRGHVLKTPNNRSFYAFQGVPYANPPLGQLRFQAPQEKEKWRGILNTTKTSNRCYSVVKDTDDESEDCLYVNVYTPLLETENKTKLPVMVFIYGGGFRDGASAYSTFGPDFLLESDLVVVSFNYRVGPFGFLSTGDEVIPGNAGLKDQVLALKWINKNIGLFGGDSTKITLFGQSAGAASVGYHILSKQSAGLFRAAIAESGSPLNEWGFLAEPRPYGFELASKISGTTVVNSSTELLNFLVSVTAKEIDIASTQTIINDRALPVLEKESDDAFLTNEMYELLVSGDINKVPLLIGINSEESLKSAANHDSFYNKLVNYEKDATLLIPNNVNLADSSNKSEIGEEIKRIYVEPGKKMQDNLGKSLGYFSDNSYIRAIIKHAELQSKYADVYFYQFSHKGPMGNNNMSVEGAENVGHSEERYYYFRTQSTSYDNSDITQFPVSDILTHYRMVKIWINFAKTMNPTPEKTGLLQYIIWPKVKPDNFQYVDINDKLEIRTNPKEQRYQAWKKIYEKWGSDHSQDFNGDNY